MKCEAKHLADMPNEEFNCPKCGAKVGIFHVEDSHDDECERLVASDTVICDECGYGTTAGRYVRQWMEAKSLVTCPHCKGRGVVVLREQGNGQP
jgi:predicted nucleic acid-binding Zn ribbon protein